jgi:NAD(P)-dependent dehydrogenase (short-subunit alcohol dehydrogenase family)
MSNGNYKTAIITGGSRGLGRNTAISLARRGADILFSYHSNVAEAQSLIREAEAIGRKAAAFRLDAGSINLFDGFVNDARSTLQSWGRDRFTNAECFTVRNYFR